MVFQCPFAENLKQKQSMILDMNDQYLTAIALLKEQSVISHGDLDPKNVLWDKSDQPILIDWESARKLNPTYEIVNASLDWSGITTDECSVPSFTRMLQAYVEAGGDFNQSHLSPAIYGVIGNWLNWMLYNIERSCISDVTEQREIGIEQVNQVLMTIVRLHGLIPELISVGWVL